MAAESRPLSPNPYSPAIRLLLIPFLVYLAWLIEIFLLAGRNRLLVHPDPGGMILYTLISCVLTGMVIPIIIIRKAFASGAVTMYQIGFRTLKRTLAACSLSAALVLMAILFSGLSGTEKAAFGGLFLLLVPTAAAAVMICWVLVGTHLQASVRSGGPLVSVPVGTVMTGLLFAVSLLVLNPSAGGDGSVVRPLLLGMAAALFFFAVRDVYATTIVVTAISASVSTGIVPAPPLNNPDPLVYPPAVAAVAALLLIHLYLATNYRTIIVVPEALPADREMRERT